MLGYESKGVVLALRVCWRVIFSIHKYIQNACSDFSARQTGVAVRGGITRDAARRSRFCLCKLLSVSLL